MYSNGGDQLVGVVGVHGVGAVRVPQTLGDSPKPTNVKVTMPTLPTRKPAPPTFKGTRPDMIALPSDDATIAWQWDAKAVAWRLITRAEGLAKLKAQGYKATAPVKPANPFADVSSGSSTTAKPKPANPFADVGGGSSTTAPVVKPTTPPMQPGRFVGEIFLPSDKAAHAWRWDGKVWRGISRSDAVKVSGAPVTAAAKAAAAPSLLDRITGAVTKTVVAGGNAEQSLFDKVVAKLKPVAPTPHPSVPTIAPGAAAPGYVPTSTGTPAKLPTKLDPDADGQIAPGKPAPPATRGVPGTFPSTALDSNGDGIVDATGQAAPPPTKGVPGTFPSTALDKNGDGIIDATGASAPPPMLGHQGSYPATPDDANGDGLNDTTGKPLNANAFHVMGLDLGSMTIPLLGAAAALLLFSGKGQGGSVRQWR